MIVLKILLMLAGIYSISSCNNPADKPEKEATAHELHTMPSASFGYADSINNGVIEKDTMKSSPQRRAMATVGKTHVHISYHSPGVKGRIVLGGLVPYNTVWVTGAHTATSIQISQPVEINNKKIEAGTYAIFTIPGEDEWIFILNKNYQQHLTDDYKAGEDVLRFVVKPIENKLTPRLTYIVNKVDDKNGSISILWEKIKIEVPFRTLD